MLAFVANTTASWESFMNTTNDRETDHAQGLLAVTESAASSRLTAEPILLPASARIDHRRKAREDFRSRFLTTLLRALSAWPV